MKIPPMPSQKQIDKLTRAEIESRLAEFDLEWKKLRNWSLEDEPDPFLMSRPKNVPTHEQQEFNLNAGRLHSAPFHAWISSLTASQIEKVRKEYKIPTSAWTKRTASLEESRRLLSYALSKEVR